MFEESIHPSAASKQPLCQSCYKGFARGNQAKIGPFVLISISSRYHEHQQLELDFFVFWLYRCIRRFKLYLSGPLLTL